MHSRKRRWLHIGMGIGLFLAGSVAGSTLTQKVSAVNRFGQPKTGIHVVAYKFRAATSQNDQDQAINGIRDMAGANQPSNNNLLITPPLQPTPSRRLSAPPLHIPPQPTPHLRLP